MPIEAAISVANQVSKAITEELSRLPYTARALRALETKLNAISGGGGPQASVIETPFTFADFAAGSKSSATIIPANADVQFAYVKVTTPFTAGATIDLGQSGSTSLLLANTSVDLTVAAIYGGPSATPWGATARAVLMTLGGGGGISAGVGKLMVIYATPRLLPRLSPLARPRSCCLLGDPMSLPNESNFSQSGVSENVQLGLGGPRIKVIAGVVTARNAADSGLARMGGAPGTAAGDYATMAQLDAASVGASFSADEMSAAAIAGAASQVPAGNGLTTADATLPKWMIARASQVAGFSVRHVGDAANVGGQTVTYTLRKLSSVGVDTLVATSAALPTTAGAKHDEQTLGSPIALSRGDCLYVVATPSAALTATVTELTAGAG